jgi:hypothetical protein
MMRLLAKIFGTYVVFGGLDETDEIRGWIWRERLYFDRRERKKYWWVT